MLTDSAENVENVVKPPKKPVVTKSRISGLILPDEINPMAIPIKYPPSKLASKVPKGSTGYIAFNAMLNPHLSQAPIAAPSPTTAKLAQFITPPNKTLIAF
jgi:hypothetical protein